MSGTTIGSFGEQTLDALLEAECCSNTKNNTVNKKGADNLRNCKPFFIRLQEIKENLTDSRLKNNHPPCKNYSAKLVTNDDTNIEKYFQESILLSKTDTSGLPSKIICGNDNVKSKKNNEIDLIEDASGNNKFLYDQKGQSSRKESVGVSLSKQDLVKLSEEFLIVESSADEKSNNNSRAVTNVRGLRKKCISNNTALNDVNFIHSSSNDKIVNNNLVNMVNKKTQDVQIEKRTQSGQLNDLLQVCAQPVNNDLNSIPESVSEYSIVNTQYRCKLSAWGLPPDILQKYELRGMTKMFPWQVECLSNYRVLEENKNLVYSAPTSAGKTFVAEMLVIKTVLERQKKVIFILPFVSVVREKMFYFQDLLSSSGIRVEGFMGGIAPAGGLAAAHIAIATIEKANSLINRLMEEGDLSSLGAVVVDELHLLGDPHRGYLLELLLTKLKYMTLREEHVKIQLIGMSATLPNLSVLAEWLDAELFSTEFRPVPLNEQYKVRTTIYDNKFVPVRELDPSPELPNDSDNILQLCIETISDGHSTLIFCPTKNWCEKLAHQVAAIFFKLGSEETTLGKILRNQLDSNAIEETLSQLKRCPAGLDDILKSTVSFGVAFHHAGLTMDERDIIECSFRTGSLRVLIATSTLSSGVNLPARRVIIRSLMFHGKVIDTLTYRQMIGRAGRMGKDTAGESILICKPNEKKAAESLLSAPLDPVESCLEGSGPLIRALLEAVASEVACTPVDINLYGRCMLASFNPENNVGTHTKEAMDYLTTHEFITVQETKEKEQRWVATALGKACLASSVSPGEGLFLFEELQRARKCFVLETELHIIYLVTPFNSGSLTSQIDWMIFFNLWKSLSECERRVGQMVGIEERFVMSAIRGIAKHGKQQNIHRRFFTALALHDLVREMPLTTVSEKYGCSRGVLQSLQQSASTFAGMVTQFCKQLGWDCMELLFCQFQARLQFGVCRELLDLLRLPMLNGLRARSLYKEGIKCVADLATADELCVERALHKALPFESEKEQDGEHVLDAAKRNKVRSIFVTGRDGLTPYQAAVLLVQEARTLVQHELGVTEVHWKQDNVTSRNKLGTILDDKSNASAIQDHYINQINNQIAMTIPAPIRTASSIANDATSQDCTENSKTIKDVWKSDNDSVDAIQQTENCETGNVVSTVISDLHSHRIEYREIKMDGSKITHHIRNEEIDLRNKLQGETMQTELNNHKITRGEKHVNEIVKNKPKFSLLGAKRKIRAKDSVTSISSDNFQQIISETATFGSPKSLKTPDNERSKSKILNNGPDDTKTNITERNLQENCENICNKISEKSSPSKMVLPDFKLSISPVVTLEWSSFNEKMSSKQSSEELGKSLRPESFSEQGKKDLRLNDEKKVSLSRSPSLFGDSLYLDSQFCNELEKNVYGSLDITKVKGTECSAIDSPSISLQKPIAAIETKGKTPEIIVKQTSSSEDKFSSNTNAMQNRAVTENPDLNNHIFNSEEINFSWNSTTWDHLKESNNASNLDSGKKKLNLQMTSNDFDISDEIAATPMMQNTRLKSISIKSNTQNVRNLKLIDNSGTRKRKFNETHSLSDSSPVLNVLNLSHNRRLSFGSNKSDSDDLIAASQNLESIKNTTKSRTRIKLESSKRIMINKKQHNSTLTKCNEQSNAVKTKNIELIRTGNASAKKVLYQENCSTDSVVSNSEEDSPIQRMRATQNLHKRTVNSSFIVQKIENLRKCKKRCLRSDVREEQLNSEQTVNWNVLDIINVTLNDNIFKLFSNELKQKTEIAIALAHNKFVNDTIGIGSKLVSGSASRMKNKFKKNESCVYLDTVVNGVAISWGRNVIYWISFENRKEGSITLKDRLQLLRDVFTDSSVNVRCYGSKEVYKKLHQCCKITPNCRFLDPKVAEWLLQPETDESNICDMAKMYFPQGATILQHASSLKSSAGTSSGNDDYFFDRHKAAAVATVTWHVTSKLIEELHKQSQTLLNTFEDVETKVVSTLARMELTGIGLNLESLQELSAVLQEEMSSLEQRAYSLAGRKFSFTSSKEVAQVLGMYKGVKVSTNKAVLENCDNPISKQIMSWRKLNTTQTKMVFPLLNLAQQGPRVRGCCLTRTATGRISMHEPNLQNVPRDFNSENNSYVISMRMAFVPTCGNIMLSADYCQLELRILAHLSKDPVLCEIMKKDSDIFKNIAAQWNYITIDEVDDDMRQRTKQLCYGIIYGMGSRALAKQLSVTELEASRFMESFMGTYPNVNNWLNRVITESRENGYVTTLMERRRLLPSLNSEIKSERSQAERQAVNTKIQGSAADLAKKAMVLIDERLQKEYSGTSRVISEMKTRKLRSSKDSQNRGAYLVLQLHDELLYEVNAADLDRVAAIVKISMEEAYQLTIPLPVKIKVGPTWGSLTEYTVQKPIESSECIF
ncbi:DNA polymerase theta [Neodiprion virginianus]|uniref:DNA polymerase theta n=1 Tax=Neodiprion virginianus TaxID=2961670 RepID=UPI001EE7510A|nr:DNA polymerase theta [Neodiprion virginianus]